MVKEHCVTPNYVYIYIYTRSEPSRLPRPKALFAKQKKVSHLPSTHHTWDCFNCCHAAVIRHVTFPTFPYLHSKKAWTVSVEPLPATPKKGAPWWLDGGNGSSQRHQDTKLLMCWIIMESQRLSSWWLNQPLWKIWFKMGIFPNFLGENKKCSKPPPSLFITLNSNWGFGPIFKHQFGKVPLVQHFLSDYPRDRQ